jgi:hypothetical protein
MKPMYYFVSNKNFDGQILHPRIPKNRLTEKGVEDSIIPRICVSKSLIGCIQSTEIYPKYKRIYVHTCDSNNIIQPTRKQVNDSYLFGEEWILEPVKMELFTVLHVTKEIINEQYSKWKFMSEDESISFSIVNFDFGRFYEKKKD